jgi:hypothetical protein
MQLPFNEQSLSELRVNNKIVSFYKQLELLVKLLDLQELPNVIFKSDFASIDINGLGTIYNIVKASGLLPEQESTLFAVIQNTPYIDEGKCIPYEVTYKGKETYGFLFSHFYDQIAISIPHDNWKKFDICVQKNLICEDTDQIICNDTSIRHIGDLAKYEDTWFKSLIPVISYSDPNEFAQYITDTYSKLSLSDTSLEYLQNLNIGKLRRLQRSLDILELYCNEYWKFGNLQHSIINDLGLNTRPESTSTMQLYGDQRIFRNEADTNETFTIHFDVSGGERAYIKGVSGEKSVFIAYIGAHLSTKKFPK